MLALNACKPDNEKFEAQADKQVGAQKQMPAILNPQPKADKSPAFLSASILDNVAMRQQSVVILENINSSALTWNDGSESNTTKRLKELIALQAWLSSTEGYGNLVLSAECEWKSMEGIVKGVIAGKLSPSDAKLMLNSLRANSFDVKSVGRIITNEMPKSPAAKSIGDHLQSGQLKSLTKAASMLLKAEGVDGMSLPDNKVAIIDKPNVAHAVLFLAITTRFSGWADGLVSYLLAGGNVSLEEKELVEDISKKLPLFFNSLSTLTGEKEGPERIAYLIKKWSN